MAKHIGWLESFAILILAAFFTLHASSSAGVAPVPLLKAESSQRALSPSPEARGGAKIAAFIAGDAYTAGEERKETSPRPEGASSQEFGQARSTASAPSSLKEQGLAAANGLARRSLSVSPDGQWLAYGRAHRSTPGRVELRVRSLALDLDYHVSDNDYAKPTYAPQPTWSPNGRFLAYYGTGEGILQLHVWDREHRRDVQARAIPVSMVEYTQWEGLKWTPDSRYVLCIADTDIAARLDEDGGDLLAEVAGQVPAPSGVTVLATPTIAPALAAQLGIRTGPKLTNHPRQIVALDVRTGLARVLARGAAFVGVQVSKAGGVALASVEELNKETATRVMALYLLPLPTESSTTNRAGASSLVEVKTHSPVDMYGHRLHQVAKHIPTYYCQNASLSPSGRFVAYTPRGAGDVMVIDVATGALGNATADIAARTADAQEDDLRRAVRRFDMPMYEGKFGTGFFDAPTWTADESALVLPRLIARRSTTNPYGLELWRVPRIGGGAHRIGKGTKLSLVELAVCSERPHVPCAAGPDGSMLALARILHDDLPSDSFVYTKIDVGSGAIRILRDAGRQRLNSLIATTSHDFIRAQSADTLVGLEENLNRPPELVEVTVHQNETRARALNVLNPDFTPIPLPDSRVMRLQWTSSSGESLFALLRLPPAIRDGERIPVIIDVYPGRGWARTNALSFGGGASRLDPLLANGHFAILKPDLPVVHGSGHVCADYSRYAVEALEAAIQTNRIDGTRAGVMGASNGGYAVNCIVTGTDRFRAAVSEIGPSDLTSYALTQHRAFSVHAGARPWEAPERMVAESPVYRLDRVKTPLLLVAGKKDLAHALQEYEMYRGLLALGKPAAFLAYDDAHHGDYDRFPDFWPRILRWFGTYLEHAPALEAADVAVQ